MFDFFKAVPKKRKVRIKPRGGIIFKNLDWKGKTIFYAGTWVFCLGVIYFGYLYWPLGSALVRFNRSGVVNLAEQEKEVPQEIKITEEKSKEFWVQIPKILAQSNIVANVSPFNPDEYLNVLKDDLVAHSDTSNLPGGGKNIYLFAHSTQQGLNMVRKNSVFYLLGELDKGDKIFVNFEGKIFTYSVSDKKIVNAKEVEYLYGDNQGEETLTLQTCWPIGTDWKRLLVFANLDKKI